MTEPRTTILVPHALASIDSVEAVYSYIRAQVAASAYALDMSRVDFVTPYGVIAVVLAARLLAERSKQPVVFTSVQPQVLQYLERIDVFKVGHEWLVPPPQLSERWLRNSGTPNLLELTLITGPHDVETAMTRANRIFQRWLSITDLNTVLAVLSEVCANIYQHSGDGAGCVVIQKYTSAGKTSICLAVGDLGCGVRGSLQARHGVLGEGTLPYLREAMNGRTSRANGRGGLGLRLVEQRVRETGGSFWLRTEDAAVHSQGADVTKEVIGLADIRGTQLVVDLHAPHGA